MSATAHILVAAASHPATAAAASIAATASAAATAAVEASDGVASFIQTTVPSVVASILPSGVTTTAPDAAKATLVTVPVLWELLAVFAGGLSGGLAAVRRNFDVMGIITLAVVTGLGGGIIRDVLLQRYGIAAFQDNRFLLVALVAAALVFFFAEAMRKLMKAMTYVDAVSLGLFVVVGADKALRADLTLLPAIMMGVITATGGGALRDVLADEVPVMLQPGALYALAAAAGSVAYVLAVGWLDVVKEFAALFAIAMVVILRYLTLWRGWQSPTARDYTHHVAGLPRRFRDRFRR